MADVRTSDELIQAIKSLAPGYYTERDGGDWYSVTAYHDRVAEDFARRDDARRCILWLAGEPMPDGWRITRGGDLSCDLDCGQGYRATIWTRSVAKAFPDRAADLVGNFS
ncbi:MAG: hypothetical protein E5V52_02060 [Mesorhizobium sp.]|uniref:hypothetical protein n=1 Tax=Mesorhizobium sp. M2A.F.Ca.ET.067.02.1.1 TaxID=2496749 RepID=UPI000FD47B38|nr:hypothetical protein [Mesorhizobium sp. M2A.F.Ca.ET.067.02.1.1]RUW81539.1 hypothetical protein EOA28_01030 [Mesorhizobium sp. M2A.F.Ca.ET.067.02.1.1]TIU58132.1 MAG: hypothetical protein E5W35_05925 [Mesorhizobium sp.]TIW88310.1 MAG: hypothetical protein E5V52_02060 [Mesorhizobium sp.]